MDRRRERREEGSSPAPDRKANRTILIRTLVLMAVFGVVAFVPLFIQLYNIQIRDHQDFQTRAIQQQTMDNAVSANRGKIKDANGKVLARSATVYDVIFSPNDFVKVQENWDAAFIGSDGSIRTGKEGYYPRPEAAAVAQGLAEILGKDPEKIQKSIEKTGSYYEVLANRVESETEEALRQFIRDQHLSNSLVLTPTSKRYYTYGSLAAQVIGWVNPNLENTGAYGMEALYESELAGQTGRVVTAKKGDGTEMKYSFQDYYDATDGNDLTLTLDATIQFYCERVLEKGYEILYFTDEVDEFVAQTLMNYTGKPFQDAAAADALPESEEEKAESEKRAEANKPVLDFVKQALGDKVFDVRLSKVLRSGAVCLTADGPMSLEMEKYFQRMGDEMGGMKAQRVLELNADSPVYSALAQAVGQDPDKAAKYAELLYDQALIIAGIPVEDTARYTELVCSLMV